jgi:hypothetical protein
VVVPSPVATGFGITAPSTPSGATDGIVIVIDEDSARGPGVRARVEQMTAIRGEAIAYRESVS